MGDALEPDNGQVRMTGLQMGAFLVAAGDAARRRLQTRALQRTSTLIQISFRATSRTSCGVPGPRNTSRKFPTIDTASRSQEPWEAIRDLTAEHGWTTAMLEHIRADHRELAEDLTQANVSAWQQHALVGSHDGDNGGKLFVSDRASGSWRFGKRTFVLSGISLRPAGSPSDSTPAAPPGDHSRWLFGALMEALVTVLSVPAAARAEISAHAGRPTPSHSRGIAERCARPCRCRFPSERLYWWSCRPEVRSPWLRNTDPNRRALTEPYCCGWRRRAQQRIRRHGPQRYRSPVTFQTITG